MKKMIAILAIMFTALVANAQEQPEIEIPVDGKIYVKDKGTIYNKLTPIIDPKSNGHSLDYIDMMSRKVYLLNSDSEVKEAIRNVFPKEIIYKHGERKMSLVFKINSDGKVYDVSFYTGDNSPLYNINIKIFSCLEDVIKSTFRFHIPDTSVPAYMLIIPTAEFSNLTNDKPFFPPVMYKER